MFEDAKCTKSSRISSWQGTATAVVEEGNLHDCYAGGGELTSKSWPSRSPMKNSFPLTPSMFVAAGSAWGRVKLVEANLALEEGLSHSAGRYAWRRFCLQCPTCGFLSLCHNYRVLSSWTLDYMSFQTSYYFLSDTNFEHLRHQDRFATPLEAQHCWFVGAINKYWLFSE